MSKRGGYLPLCKRGIEGDLAEPEFAVPVKSPLPPFFKGGLSHKSDRILI